MESAPEPKVASETVPKIAAELAPPKLVSKLDFGIMRNSDPALEAASAGSVPGAAPINDRRASPRHAIDQDATLLILSRNQLLRCRVLNLCLNGCRVRGQDQTRLAAGMPIEITFKIQGVGFRLSGSIRWINDEREAGVCFSNRTARQTEDLRLVLAEIELKSRHEAAEAAAVREAAEAAAQSAEAMVAQQPATQSTAQPPGEPASSKEALHSGEQTGGESAEAPAGAEILSSAPAAARSVSPSRERRSQARESVDSGAIIFLVKGGARFPGRIVDLSLGGCCIRTAEPFPLGIFTRVEVEFRLHGLPFRLGGVVQSFRDASSVGIRFLDIGDRKREQVAVLMAEIEALRRQETEIA